MKDKIKFHMTAISFKSESNDDYLEISENESIDDFLNRIKDEFGEEWYYLNIVLIASTDFDENDIRHKIKNLQQT